MKLPDAMPFRVVLPLPDFVLHPLTALAIAAVHVYLAAGHLSKLISGAIRWTHIWKGFGVLAGAYVFAALASRGFSRPRSQQSFLAVVSRRRNEAESKG